MRRLLYVIEILLLAVTCILYTRKLILENSQVNLTGRNFENEDFRRMELDEEYVKIIHDYAQENGFEVGEVFATYALLNDFECKKEMLPREEFIIIRNRFVKSDVAVFVNFKEFYENILGEMEYFPVPVSTQNDYWVNYVNSWGFERTYGGKRSHEGTDIFADYDKRGIYPVVSVTSGTVTNKGWLEKGGYRIGIMSDSGIYYYYAHLAEYAEFEVGDYVEAGNIIGYMGDTGYSVVEGTTGKFPVHLHLGIYIYQNNKEISVNPYYFLQFLEKKVLYYPY